MTNAGITIGVVVGSFMFVACFALVISIMARKKNRERLLNGSAFAVITKEKSRFNGIIKRVGIVSKKPSVKQILELQEYYTGECSDGFEKEAIECTFKSMQLLGYDVRLYKKEKIKKKKREKGESEIEMVEVDLSKVNVRLAGDAKKEAKRHKDR